MELCASTLHVEVTQNDLARPENNYQNIFENLKCSQEWSSARQRCMLKGHKTILLAQKIIIKTNNLKKMKIANAHRNGVLRVNAAC